LEKDQNPLQTHRFSTTSLLPPLIPAPTTSSIWIEVYTTGLHPITQGDSPDQPIVMTPIQFIHPSHWIIGIVFAASSKETRDPTVGGNTNIQGSIRITNSNTQDPGEGGSNMIQGLIMRLECQESSNLTLWTEVGKLTHGVTKIEEENLSLKRQLNDNKEQDPLHHPPGNTLRT
jgi:hypothetical protein